MKRNGKIELLRFIFCIIVIFYHLNNDLWQGAKCFGEYFTFFSHGRTAVEFFFLTSGFLMAKSAESSLKKKQHSCAVPIRLTIRRHNIVPLTTPTLDRIYASKKNSASSPGKETALFILKKIKAVYKPYIILSVITAIYVCFTQNNALKWIADRLPSLLFLQRTGIGDEGFISVSWYIASMLFAMAVIYPFLVKWYDMVSLVAAPLISTTLIGAMIKIGGQLPQSRFEGFLHLSNLRAVAVILLGVFVYRLSKYLRAKKLTKKKRMLLIAAENLCWAVSIVFMFANVSRIYEGHITYIMATALCITFSRDFNKGLYASRFPAYLGRISLPVFLAQSLARMAVHRHLSFLPGMWRVVIITSATLVIGIVLDLCMKKRITKKG